RLMVVRLNLAYTNDDKNLVGIDVASAHREKFLANRYHNKIFKNVVGYVWGLQYLEGKGGYYHHVFLFLDCETQPDDSWHASISDYWSSITDGKGRCQNYDKGVLNYIYPGVGLVNRCQADDFIEKAASFLTMKELFFSLKYGNSEEKFRTYGKGKVPPKFHLYAGHQPN
ncbi:MAG: inovirus-type Gp2 protein, partial [Methylococcales bacterium]|nr:inovirus-type Gp2 protein [Methylococcales bacterium]